MELSLFSRDVIALATAVALSHQTLRRRGLSRHLRQDRARPGDRRARPSAICRRCSSRPGRCPRACRTTRKRASASSMPRARSAATSCWRPRRNPITAPGTCTFYGTANTNQMLMEIMGLHLPGAAFVNPEHAAARCADHEAATSARWRITALGNDYHADRRRCSTSGPSSTASSACTPPAARPTTPCI